MNRRTLVILMLLPLLIFAADQGFSALRTDTGGKQKKQSTKSTEAQAGPEINAAETLKDGGKKKHAVAKLSKAEMLDELEAGLEKQQNEYEELDYETNLLWKGDEAIPDGTSDFLDERVLEILEKANPADLDVAKSFGRCPSGYYYFISANDGEPLHEGWMIMEQGCDDEPIAKFRFDKELTKVEVKVSDRVGYVSTMEFFTLMKQLDS